MSQQAFIDGVTFALEREQLHGTLPVGTLERLSDVVLERSGEAEFALAGSVDRSGRPVIDVTVRAGLVLTCQRCLERLDYALERSTRIVLVRDGEALPEVGEEEPDVEAIPAREVANVADLVEQEILLGLPLAPTHAEGACAASAGRVEQVEQDRPQSPFAVLAGLKNSRAGGVGGDVE